MRTAGRSARFLLSNWLYIGSDAFSDGASPAAPRKLGDSRSKEQHIPIQTQRYSADPRVEVNSHEPVECPIVKAEDRCSRREMRSPFLVNNLPRNPRRRLQERKTNRQFLPRPAARANSNRLH